MSAPKRSKKKSKSDTVLSALHLTDAELAHVRDLFNVRLPSPSTGFPSVSQSLAAAEQREELEKALWDKVANLCSERCLPLERAAPDHVVVMSSPPELAVMACENEPAPEEDASPFSIEQEK